MYCYANIGVPKNLGNPYYQQTDKESNPHGYNSLGTKYVDYGLGANPNPAPDGTRFYKNVPGDIPQFRGLFKAPSLRGTDKRPSADFVKAYMHNGVFKSLKDVVHFYNKRNIAVDASGNVFVTDSSNNALVEIPFSNGSYGAPFVVASDFKRPGAVAVDAHGRLYVVDNNGVWMLTP